MTSFRLKMRSAEIDLPFGELLIGRGTDCYIRIDDDLVSRRHAKLVVNAVGVILEDLGSRNGSSVNGAAVTGRKPLSVGDTIEIGNQSFQLLKGQQAHRPTMTMLPHRACVACGTVMEATRNVCPRCGTPQNATGEVPAMALERPRTPPDALPPASPAAPPAPTIPPPAAVRPAREDSIAPSPSGTLPGTSGVGGLQLMANLFDKLMAMGRADEAERVTGPRLRETLAMAQAGVLVEATADGAIRRVSRLAIATGHDEWYRLTFDLAAAARRRLDDKTIDELHSNMMAHKPAAAAAVNAYAALYAGIDVDSQQHRRRLDALLRYCRG